MATQYVLNLTTTEDLGSSQNSVDVQKGQRPYEVLRDFGNLLHGAANGSRNVTVDVQKKASATAAGSAATLTLASVAAGEVIMVNGVRFIAVSGTAVVASNEFKRGVTDTADAASFVTTLNACTSAAIAGIVTATSALGVVTLSSVDAGAVQNAIVVDILGVVAQGNIALSSSAGTLTATINGVGVTATAGATDTASATALAAAINASSNALVKNHVFAYSDTATVYILAVYGGLRGNAITLAASGTGATASVARLAGGALAQGEGVQATGTVTLAAGSDTFGATINGVSVSVSYNASDTQTAADLTAAIAASTNALVRGFVTATSALGVVTLTAVRGGISGNAITLAATGTGASASVARLAGGAVPTHAALAGTSVTQIGSSARLAGGSGLAGGGGSNANSFTS